MCPWINQTDKNAEWWTDYPPCDNHYEANLPIAWGVNTGICNINSWAETEVQKMVDANRIIIGDNHRDDGAKNLGNERYWVIEGRAL